MQRDDDKPLVGIALYSVGPIDPKTPGQRLRRARVNAGRSMGELARHLGISVVQLSDVERDRRKPLSSEQTAAAAQLLGVQVDALASSEPTR